MTTNTNFFISVHIPIIRISNQTIGQHIPSTTSSQFKRQSNYNLDHEQNQPHIKQAQSHSKKTWSI